MNRIDKIPVCCICGRPAEVSYGINIDHPRFHACENQECQKDLKFALLTREMGSSVTFEQLLTEAQLNAKEYGEVTGRF